VASPDIADALACTFACEYATLPVSEWDMGRGDHLVRSEYNPFDDEHLKGAGFAPVGRVYAPGWAKLRDDD
jgi:hypothetical protein